MKTQLLNAPAIATSGDHRLSSLVGLLDKTVREIYDRTLSMRMTALRPLFLRLQRAVRDLSVKLGKPVDLELVGESTEIDRTLIEALGDPLVHLVRNALDHGVETAERRLEAAKPERGHITVAASQTGGRVIIEISDDGGGIQREKVLRKAIELGLLPEKADPDTISDAEVFDFLFTPGFSTADAVTDISGRGVGLDVVKSNVEKMRGTIAVDSRAGKGTTFRISLPVTTAISEGLVLLIGGNRYILPLYSVQEIVEWREAGDIALTPGKEMVRVRGRMFPLVSMQDVLRCEGSRESDGEARPVLAIVDCAGQQVALGIDGVSGQSQFVIKSLSHHLDPRVGVIGAAILGDGTTALVLDVDMLGRELKGLRLLPKEEAA